MAGTSINGIPRPNLRVEGDNQKGYEFQVQCEVRIPDVTQAQALLGQLDSKKPELINEAQTTVERLIDEYNKTHSGDERISQQSQDIIRQAFKVVHDYCKHHPPSP